VIFLDFGGFAARWLGQARLVLWQAAGRQAGARNKKGCLAAAFPLSNRMGLFRGQPRRSRVAGPLEQRRGADPWICWPRYLTMRHWSPPFCLV